MINKPRGFTIVEVVIVIPIVLLVIGVFINAIVSMTGEVLIARSSNIMSSEIQNAISQIKQDLSITSGFLATNNFNISSPQGLNNDTTKFENASFSNGNALILNTYATINNPNDSSKKIAFLSNQPNQCNSSLYTSNERLMINVVYYTKPESDGSMSLWRRVLIPSGYQQSTCQKIWQQPSCSIGQSGSNCLTEDSKLVNNLSNTDGFIIKYFTNPVIETDIPDAINPYVITTSRQAALYTAKSISVSIKSQNTVMGDTIERSYSSRLNNDNLSTKASVIPAPCPTGFIVVPGSANLGTNDFCVMKYEAKITGNDNGATAYNSAFVPESRASGTPWVNISQTNIIAESQTVCTGCHLITEQEWMTIVQNVISVPSNWSGGSVGSGYIYRGHSDSVPNNTLAASTDNDPYFGTGQSSPSNQKRTLTLTNGEIIWDFAGNVAEYTNQSTTIQPGLTGETVAAWKEWNNASLNMVGLNTTSQPFMLEQPGLSTWTSANGIGRLYSNRGSSANTAFSRGGGWTSGADGGVLQLYLGLTPTDVNIYVTFRVAR